MKNLLLIILMMMASFFVKGQGDFPEQYHWKNRIVLLFGTGADQDVKKQIAELESEPEEISDRDLLIFHIDQEVELLHGKASQTEITAAQFRAKYNVPETEFRYILLGKDGRVKYSKKEFVPNRKLFAIIDAMPMRQREMREKD